MDKDTLYGIRIYIIESLPDGDIKTGVNLYDELRQLWYESNEIDFDSNYSSVSKKVDFITSLTNIANEVETDNYVPIIQIECHGSYNGLVLSSGEELSWGELFFLLRPINIACSNLLLLNLSCCYGDKIIRNIEPFERAPFRAIIGKEGIVSAEKLQQSWLEFYKNYLEIGDCFHSIHEVVPKNFIFFNQDFIFDAHYNMAELYPDIFDKRIKKELVDMYTKEGILAIDPKMYKEWIRKRQLAFRAQYKPYFCFEDV